MISRRQFALGALAAPIIARGAGRLPTHKAKVVRLFRSPDGHPNALEATPDGLWVGEQITDKAYLLDWKSGKVLQQVETESSNTSGLAYGGGYLWMAANGAALGRLARRDEPKQGRIVKVDPASGRTMGVYTMPDGGGCHGLLYAGDKLWMTCFKWNVIAAVDPGTFAVLHKFPLHLTRAHGLAWDPPAIWVGYSNDWVFIKQDAKDGRPLEIIELEKGVDPDPHGMDMHEGKMYYCDAGIAPPGIASGSAHSGYICRVELAS